MPEAEKKMGRAKGFLFPVDIDTAYYAAIGEIAARWSWLEHRLAVLIREGFRVDKAAGRAITTSMSARTLVRTAEILTATGTWIKDDRIRGELAAFVKAVEKRRERRNDFVHGVYGPETQRPTSFYRILMKGAHVVEPSGSPVALGDLRSFAQDLRALQDQGSKLTDELKAVQRKK